MTAIIFLVGMFATLFFACVNIAAFSHIEKNFFDVENGTAKITMREVTLVGFIVILSAIEVAVGNYLSRSFPASFAVTVSVLTPILLYIIGKYLNEYFTEVADQISSEYDEYDEEYDDYYDYDDYEEDDYGDYSWNNPQDDEDQESNDDACKVDEGSNDDNVDIEDPSVTQEAKDAYDDVFPNKDDNADEVGKGDNGDDTVK